MKHLTITAALALAALTGMVLDLPGLHVPAAIGACLAVIVTAWRMDREAAL